MYKKVEDIPVRLMTLPIKEFNKESKKWGKIPRDTLMKKRRKLNKKEIRNALTCIKNLQCHANKLYDEKMEAIENYKELKEILNGLYDNGIVVHYCRNKGYIIKKENKSFFKYFDIFNIF